VPSRLASYLEALQVALEQHPLVRAAWVEGSLGRGNADRYSDVDLHVLVSEADLPAFKAEAEGWLNRVCPLVLFNLLFGGHMINALTQDGIRLDVWPHAGQTERLDPSKARVIYEVPGSSTQDLSTPTPDQAVLGRQALAQTREFWRCITLLPAVVGRGEHLVAFSGLAVELNLVAELLMVGLGMVRDRGVKNLNDYLPPEAREWLEKTVTLADLSPQALIDAHLGLARIVQEEGPRIAERYGYPYPRALETTAVRHVWEELGALGYHTQALKA